MMMPTQLLDACVGRLSPDAIARIDLALRFVMGL